MMDCNGHSPTYHDVKVDLGGGCTDPRVNRGGRCAWNFGDVIPGRTATDFGGDAQYGTPDAARYGGTLTSPVLANPQTKRVC